MTIMKKLMAGFILTLACLSAFAETKNTKPEPTTAAASTETKNKFLQFVMRAETGQVKIDESNSGLYTLELTGVNNTVTYFTNRPRRIADTMPTGYFLKRWIKLPPHDFKTTPPNAAVVFVDDKKIQGVATIILMSPVYDADSGTLKFTIKTMGGRSATMPAKLTKPVIMFAEVTVCGLLGSWGDLPGEKIQDEECHKIAQEQPQNQ